MNYLLLELKCIINCPNNENVHTFLILVNLLLLRALLLDISPVKYIDN